MAQARTLALSGGKNEGFALLVVVPAVCRHAGGNVFHSPYWFFRLAQPYLKPPRTNRDGKAAPGCVLIYVIAPYFVSNKPHELIAIALTVLAASRFSMLVTVLIGVGSSGL